MIEGYEFPLGASGFWVAPSGHAQMQTRLPARSASVQYSGAFDPSQVATWGKQVGARYIVTGKVYNTDERQDGERRVQYFMFLQVLNVETGEILFQHKTSVTKALI